MVALEKEVTGDSFIIISLLILAQFTISNTGNQHIGRLCGCTYFQNSSLCEPRQIFQAIVFAYLQHELHHLESCTLTLNDATLSFSMKNNISTGYSSVQEGSSSLL